MNQQLKETREQVISKNFFFLMTKIIKYGFAALNFIAKLLLLSNPAKNGKKY